MALHKRLCNPLGFDFEFALSKTTVNRPFINRLEKPRFPSRNNQPEAARNGVFGVEPRRQHSSAGMRMIMPDHHRTAVPRRLVRREQIPGVREVLGAAGQVVTDREMMRHGADAVRDPAGEQTAALGRRLGSGVNQHRGEGVVRDDEAEVGHSS